jgi:hypothetical protein
MLGVRRADQKERGSVFIKAIVIWVLLAAVAVANGFFRNAVITPRLGGQTGHVISTVVLCVLILAITLVFIRWIGPRRTLDASLVGLMWVTMTLAFEFLAGHYLFGHSWQKLLADYNIWHGRIWVVVPVVTYFAPRWAYRLRM